MKHQTNTRRTLRRSFTLSLIALSVAACTTPSNPTDEEASKALQSFYKTDAFMHHWSSVLSVAGAHVNSCVGDEKHAKTLHCDMSWDLDGVPQKSNDVLFWKGHSKWTAIPVDHPSQ